MSRAGKEGNGPEDVPDSSFPKGIQVCKFGGTSLANAECLKRAFGIVAEHLKTNPCVVVVSAMGGITNRLIDAAERAVEGNLEPARATASVLKKSHDDLIDELLADVSQNAQRQALKQHVAQSVAEFENICASLAVLREKTPRILDSVVARGERLLALIFSRALEASGVRASFVDATEILFMQAALESGVEGPSETLSRAALDDKLGPLLRQKVCVVVPGFIATGPSGEVVTLGRGGSDYSATILAALLGAAQVTLYKEVEGLLTADPRLVPDARIIRHLHFREATELAFYGAKVLHPRTMIPLMRDRIPLVVRSSFRPDLEGTRISADAPPGEYPVKALTAIEGQALVTIQGNGMMGVPGIAGRTFIALAKAGISTSFISQASSESSICFVVPEEQSEAVKKVLQETFVTERRHGLIEDISVRPNVALVAVVGLGMRGHTGVAARTMQAIATASVNIIAIAQGSSELNISLAIKSSDTRAALRALHREYRLHDLDARPEQRDHQANVCVFGFGQIGRALCQQVLDQRDYLLGALHLDLRISALGDRSELVSVESGFSDAVLRSVLASKSEGKALGVIWKSHQENFNQEPLRRVADVNRLFETRAAKSIFVDVTAAETFALVRAAVTQGWHVVLANKKPLAVNQEDFDELFGLATELGCAIRYEATVGAGLPVLDTLAKLRAAGDQILSIEGCLSGTLGYLVSRLSEGVGFSAAVGEAMRAGYTEPDAREDLGGMDVARKALILARTLGMRLNLSDITVEALFPESLRGPAYAKPDALLEGLRHQDESFSERIARATHQGNVLRYVAQINVPAGEVKVGLVPVSMASPMGRLTGTENQVLIRSKRYLNNPLVVTGPGAGADVTAAGVLGDIVAIGEREWVALSGATTEPTPSMDSQQYGLRASC